MKRVLILVLLLASVASGASVEVRVGLTGDDVFVENTDEWYPNEQVLAFSSVANRMGLRFQNITIPQGSEIDSAVIFFTSNEGGNDSTATFTIRCQEGGDADSFTTYSNFDGRDRTEASASWVIAATGWSSSGVDAYKTADFAAVVEEVVKGTWASGYDLVVFIDYASGAGSRAAYAYEGVPLSAPKIRIVYSEAAGCADTLVAPTFTSPANSATGQSNSVILDWADSTQAGTVDFYQVQVDNNSDFGSITWADTTSYSADTISATLDYSTTYYWRVRGASDCDTSAYSGYRSFTMEDEPAPPAELTGKILYITRADTTTGSRNSNVDSLKNFIESQTNWTVDLLQANYQGAAESKDSSFWNQYDLIITWGTEENGAAANYDTLINDILDTLPIPVVCRDAYTANGDPMWLGTTARNSSSSYYRLDNANHYITRTSYTDNANFGDSLRIYNSAIVTHALTGMANQVQVLVRHAADLNSADADTALLVVCADGDSNAAGTLAPANRAYFALAREWRYVPYSARQLFLRTLLWAAGETLDTAVTTVWVQREGVDGTWLEYSGSLCQDTWHYGNTGLRMGYEVADRVAMIRARSTALSRALPDTTEEWAYDIVDARVKMVVSAIGGNSPTYSWWQGIFVPKYGDQALWADAKTSIQLDSLDDSPVGLCTSYDTEQNHAYSNAYYYLNPTIEWDSPRAGTRGTDYEMVALDSVWLESPVVGNIMHFDIPPDTIQSWTDSTHNNGFLTHTIGTKTGYAEISIVGDQATGASSEIVNGVLFEITLDWRAANGAADDLDSLIGFTYDSLIFVATEDGSNPLPQVQTVSNAASAAVFTCTSPTEDPAASWLTNTVFGGGYTTYYIQHAVDISGLSAGYYSTTISNACTDVSNSPGEYKVVLIVYGSEQIVRPAGGSFIIR